MAAPIGPKETLNGRMYQVLGNTHFARHRDLDVLRHVRDQHLSREQWAKIILLAVCLLVYVAFHWVRLALPEGFWRSSLPSMLVMPVMLAVTDLFPSIRFHTWLNKVAITLAVTLAATLWFEFTVPAFYSRSTSDTADAAAMLLGWLLYLAVDRAGYAIKRLLGPRGMAGGPGSQNSTNRNIRPINRTL
jgi:hypothetical protein